MEKEMKMVKVDAMENCGNISHDVMKVDITMGEELFSKMYEEMVEAMGKTEALDALAILDSYGIIIGD